MMVMSVPKLNYWTLIIGITRKIFSQESLTFLVGMFRMLIFVDWRYRIFFYYKDLINGVSSKLLSFELKFCRKLEGIETWKGSLEGGWSLKGGSSKRVMPLYLWHVSFLGGLFVCLFYIVCNWLTFRWDKKTSFHTIKNTWSTTITSSIN